MENNSITKLILGFLVLIVGLALIGSVAVGTTSVTDKIGASSETVDIALDRALEFIPACPMSINGTYPLQIANSPEGWKQADCPISDFVMLNQSGIEATTVTDYVFYPANGTILLKNTSLWGNCVEPSNATTVSYTYCSDTYLNIAWGRTILDLVSGFFALALLGVSVGLFYSVGKDMGLIN